MATFAYIARSDPARTQEGTIDAESVLSAARELKTQGLYPVRIEVCLREAGRLGWLAGRFRRREVGLAVLAEFTDQLADLLDAGKTP